MGFLKNMAIKRVSKKHMIKMHTECLRSLKGKALFCNEHHLKEALMQIYLNSNGDLDVGEKPDNLDDVFFWVLNNVYWFLLEELSYDSTFGAHEDLELLTETVMKNMYLFRNFKDQLSLADKTN
jgi:hypothetical protein